MLLCFRTCLELSVVFLNAAVFVGKAVLCIGLPALAFGTLALACGGTGGLCEEVVDMVVAFEQIEELLPLFCLLSSLKPLKLFCC